MSLEHLLTTFAGRPVQRLDRDDLPDSAAGVAWRVGFGAEDEYDFYDSPLPDNPDDRSDGELLFEPLERWDQTPHLQALVISCWGEPADFFEISSASAAEALVQLAPRLTSLEALFFGDIPRFMSDLAYIVQSDLGAVVGAFPQLKTFGARGGESLRLSGLHHDGLEALTLESSGLRLPCVQDVTSAHLPNLRRLDLWLGTANYGLEATAADLAPLLSGKLFPNLTHLGLMNTDIADELAVALSTSPLLERLESLDLSLGTISDNGLKPLLQHPALRRLKHLNLEGHFLSQELAERLPALLPDTALRLDTPNSAYLLPQDRYIAHGE